MKEVAKTCCIAMQHSCCFGNREILCNYVVIWLTLDVRCLSILVSRYSESMQLTQYKHAMVKGIKPWYHRTTDA